MPAGFTFPDFTGRDGNFDGPGLDGEVEMGEGVPKRRELSRLRHGTEARGHESPCGLFVREFGRRPQATPDAAWRAALEQHARA